MSDPIYLFKAKDTRKRGIKFELIKLSSSSWSLFIGIKTKVLQKKRKVHFSLKLSKNQWIKPMKCNAPSFFLISFLFIFFFFAFPIERCHTRCFTLKALHGSTILMHPCDMHNCKCSFLCYETDRVWIGSRIIDAFISNADALAWIKSQRPRYLFVESLLSLNCP